MNTDPPNHQSSLTVRGIYGLSAVLAALALALKGNHWNHTGIAEWGPTLTLLGLLVLMATGALNVARGPLRLCLSIIGVVGIACGSLIVFTR